MMNRMSLRSTCDVFIFIHIKHMLCTAFGKYLYSLLQMLSHTKLKTGFHMSVTSVGTENPIYLWNGTSWSVQNMVNLVKFHKERKLFEG